ncbi:hypothetical protein STAFG_3316 [Streptomyces afghaniensis 772]|uniref:Uncharacterized protein n=1 Tax=Streptomyces afghaniensis 772 TaxID=1283301 RepID=S4MJ88_9ACTN|nr:hypothetical protein STAFG_3316 [Streptomyces afghaniensis 772]
MSGRGGSASCPTPACTARSARKGTALAGLGRGPGRLISAPPDADLPSAARPGQWPAMPGQGPGHGPRGRLPYLMGATVAGPDMHLDALSGAPAGGIEALAHGAHGAVGAERPGLIALTLQPQTWAAVLIGGAGTVEIHSLAGDAGPHECGCGGRVLQPTGAARGLDAAVEGVCHLLIARVVGMQRVSQVGRGQAAHVNVCDAFARLLGVAGDLADGLVVHAPPLLLRAAGGNDQGSGEDGCVGDVGGDLVDQQPQPGDGGVDPPRPLGGRWYRCAASRCRAGSGSARRRRVRQSGQCAIRSGLRCRGRTSNRSAPCPRSPVDGRPQQACSTTAPGSRCPCCFPHPTLSSRPTASPAKACRRRRGQGPHLPLSPRAWRRQA